MEKLDCGHVASPHSEYTTGYGVDSSGKKHCYACCHAQDLAQLKDTTKPFFAYVNGDGKSITNWPGSTLMRITSESTGRGGFGGRMYYYRAIDANGQQWHGKNAGRGMCIKLKACRV